uniref:Uncharacterized protein n=1 Tax=Electrophorus electricus TaxID=8005 RepID=A0A4W4H787_ELEEL
MCLKFKEDSLRHNLRTLAKCKEKALKQLMSDDTIMIKPANKVGSIVNQDKTAYSVLQEDKYKFYCSPIPVIYTLQKIHKNLEHPLGRPIVSGSLLLSILIFIFRE